MKKLVIKNIAWLFPYSAIFICLLFIILSYDKIDIHVFINSYHNHFFDIFFKYLTYFGDGVFALIFTILLSFINIKWSIISAVSNILTLLTVQFSKLLIFADFHRPKYFFDYFYKGDHVLHMIEGATPGIHYSFPSGHSATAFAVFFFLALIVKNNCFKFSLLLFALMVAFSRVYLSWHFVQDTVAGSLYGMVITFFSFYFLHRSINEKYNVSILYMKKKK